MRPVVDHVRLLGCHELRADVAAGLFFACADDGKVAMIEDDDTVFCGVNGCIYCGTPVGVFMVEDATREP